MKLDAADLAAFRPLIEEIVRATLAEIQQQNSASLEVFTEREAAAMLKMTPEQLANQRRLGNIDASRGPRRSVRYTRTQLQRYLDGLSADPAPQQAREGRAR